MCALEHAPAALLHAIFLFSFVWVRAQHRQVKWDSVSDNFHSIKMCAWYVVPAIRLEQLMRPQFLSLIPVTGVAGLIFSCLLSPYPK